jgi:hypothetical protein
LRTTLTVWLIENLSLNSLLTCDGTLKKEQMKKTPFPLRNIWILATQTEQYIKMSNKSQEFAKEKATKLKKKSFEELVSSYLTNIFIKMGLTSFLPPNSGLIIILTLKTASS